MVKTAELSDFSGGLKYGFAATDFTERQWSELFGVLFDGDRTLRAQWARQLLEPQRVESFWVWDGKIVYRTPPQEVPDPAYPYDYEATIEVSWFGAGLPADNTDDGLNKFLFSDIVMRWDDPVSGFWDSGFAWV
jgi:hypothetical protein